MIACCLSVFVCQNQGRVENSTEANDNVHVFTQHRQIVVYLRTNVQKCLDGVHSGVVFPLLPSRAEVDKQSPNPVPGY